MTDSDKTKQIQLETDLYIKVLKYAKNNPNGITLNDIREKFDLNGKETEVVKKQLCTSHGGSPPPLITETTQPNQRGEGREKLYILSFNGTMRLLEYEELEQARKSSRRALYVAIAALLTSILVGIFQIGIDLIDLNTPNIKSM